MTPQSVVLESEIRKIWKYVVPIADVVTVEESVALNSYQVSCRAQEIIWSLKAFVEDWEGHTELKDVIAQMEAIKDIYDDSNAIECFNKALETLYDWGLKDKTCWFGLTLSFDELVEEVNKNE